MPRKTASKKVFRACSLSLGGFQVLLLWKGVSCSLAKAEGGIAVFHQILFSSPYTIVVGLDTVMLECSCFL